MAGAVPWHLEEHFIMRLPLNHAKDVAVGIEKDSLRNALQLDLGGADRTGKAVLRLGNGVELQGRLVNLPTITESLKTVDNKFFYKIADISQMVEFSEPAKELRPNRDDGGPASNLGEWPHGLTPPLKNVRRKRFRKTAKKQADDNPRSRITQAVSDLLAADKKSVLPVQVTIEDPDDVAKMSDLDAFGANSEVGSTFGDNDSRRGSIRTAADAGLDISDGSSDENASVGGNSLFSGGGLDDTASVMSGPASINNDSASVMSGNGSMLEIDLDAPSVTSSSAATPASLQYTGTGARADTSSMLLPSEMQSSMSPLSDGLGSVAGGGGGGGGAARKELLELPRASSTLPTFGSPGGGSAMSDTSIVSPISAMSTTSSLPESTASSNPAPAAATSTPVVAAAASVSAGAGSAAPRNILPAAAAAVKANATTTAAAAAASGSAAKPSPLSTAPAVSAIAPAPAAAAAAAPAPAAAAAAAAAAPVAARPAPESPSTIAKTEAISDKQAEVDAQEKRVNGQKNPALKKRFTAKLDQLKKELATLQA